MSVTLKVMILATMFFVDLVAGGMVARRLLSQGAAAKALIVCGALFMGWIVTAVILFVVI